MGRLEDIASQNGLTLEDVVRHIVFCCVEHVVHSRDYNLAIT
jgi:hypothetical protein